MPRISAAADPDLARRLLQETEKSIQQSNPSDAPRVGELRDTVFQLCGGYFLNSGDWVKEFEVRELTGRDEEYLGRVKDTARYIIGLLARGLVRVGPREADGDVLDSMLAGDWETALLAIRIVTFGDTVEVRRTCKDCGEQYKADIDLRNNVEYREVEREDLRFVVEGRRKTYLLSHPYGTAQRKVLQNMDATVAESNTIILSECIEEIDGLPLVGTEVVKGLSMGDRRKLVTEIDRRRVGPRLMEVRTKCPACDNEQPSPLNIVALFQS